jgi:hypothetical protein
LLKFGNGLQQGLCSLLLTPAVLLDRRDAILALAEERIERLEDLELPTYEAEEPDGAAEGWLFDSRRGYVTQQHYFNNRKFGTPIEDQYDEDEYDEDEEEDEIW